MLVLSENPITAVRAVGVIHILLGRRVAMGQGNRVAAVAMLVLDRHRAVVVGKLDEDADAGQEGAVNGGGQARAAVVSGGGLAQAAAVNGGGPAQAVVVSGGPAPAAEAMVEAAMGVEVRGAVMVGVEKVVVVMEKVVVEMAKAVEVTAEAGMVEAEKGEAEMAMEAAAEAQAGRMACTGTPRS